VVEPIVELIDAARENSSQQIVVLILSWSPNVSGFEYFTTRLTTFSRLRCGLAPMLWKPVFRGRSVNHRRPNQN